MTWCEPSGQKELRADGEEPAGCRGDRERGSDLVCCPRPWVPAAEMRDARTKGQGLGLTKKHKQEKSSPLTHSNLAASLPVAVLGPLHRDVDRGGPCLGGTHE